MKQLSAFGRRLGIVYAIVIFLTPSIASAQISGFAFKDYNFNGSQQTSGFPIEPGVYGVTVRAYNSANVLLGTKTTSATGTYNFTAGEIPSGTAVRLEFSTTGGAYNAKSGSANATDIQFITAPSTTANYAIASQDWYSNTANPYTATNGFTNGNAIGGGSAGTNNNLYIFPYDMGNGTPNDGGATRRLPNSQLGSVYGLAFQKTSRTLFMSAYLKRHSSFGPNGIGAIYKTVIDATGVPATASLLVDVNTIGINVGTDPRTVTLPAASNARNADVGVFAEVGKRGIGGIDISEDGRDLYIVNMFEKRLHRINVGNPLKATITAADVTGNWIITDPGIAGTVWHPMACKTANGKVYIGGVTVQEKTTAHVLNTDTVGARGIIYEFDPATQVFTEVLRFPFNYRRGFGNNDFRYPTKDNWWCGWQNNGNGGAADPIQADYNTANGAFTGGVYYPQPMLADIEFDVDGAMVLGIRDRFGDQMGYQNVSEDGLPTGTGFGGGNNYFRGLTSGEVLRAGRNLTGAAFTLENRGQVTNFGVTTGTLDAAAAGNPAVGGNWSPTTSGTPWGGFFGPGWGGTAGTIPGGGPNPGTQGGYFYFNHNFTTTGTPGTLNGTAGAAINSHYLKSTAGLTLLAGSNEVMHTLMDPITVSYTNGVSRLVNSGASAGNMSQRLQLIATITGTPGDPANMGKSNGIGNLELLTDYEPIEIGNRIWNDANGDGLQDAGEAGINGVSVQLVSPGPDGIFGNGDDVVVAVTTTATVNGQSGSYFFSTLTTNDARKPAAWIGLPNDAILPGFNYRVRILNATGGSQQAALAGLQPTGVNIAANGFDNTDSDGLLSGTTLSADFNSFNTSHSFDFGFKGLAALGDRVWRDDDADGVQDAGEPGVAGIQVTLFRDLNTDGDFADPGENAPYGATVTDAYGNYLFENLPIGNYQVQITPPANYSITTQTNTADNENAGAATGSDVSVVTGRSYTVNLSAGERELDIDAGLVYNLPTAVANIGDRVWLDVDQDGIQDAGEPGISGVTVTLYNSAGVAVATTVTDAAGNYLFQNVTPGTGYRIGFTPPAGMLFSPKDQGGNDNTDSDVNTTGTFFGRTDAFTVTAGTTNLTFDAGLYPQSSATRASLGDFVWNDLNQDGIQTAGEPGVPGVTVFLITTTGTKLDSTITDAFGRYQFNNLTPATYGVRFILPGGYSFSPANQGSNDYLNSDAGRGANSNESQGVTLNAGSNNPSVDAGIFQTAPAGTSRIGDRVWFDTNKNGIQDATEPGVAGVTVTLYTNGVDGLPGTADDVLVRTTVTDGTGYYQFVNLANGSYNVGFSNLPAGYGFTTRDQTAGGGTDSNDSDADPATGRTTTITISAPATSIQTVDAGLTPGQPSGKGSLGNRVWYDLDNDGIQDAGEGGVPGVTVTLQKDLNNDGDFADAGEGTFAATTTNAIGEYMFFNLDAGSYRVQFSTLPSGYTAATQNAGANDNIDSDGGTITGGISTTGAYSLAQGEDNLTVDFGIVNAARNTLGDLVWFDINADGVQNAGEPGVAGVTVVLLDGSGNVYDSDGVNAGVQPLVTTTDVNGNYIFSNLPDGSYSVQFINLPAGFNLTTKDQTGGGGNDNNDSDADLVSGKTGAVTLNSGSRLNTSLDAGLVNTRASLGNYVWVDENGDGIQDATEPPVPGVTVTLFYDANNDGDFADAGENLAVASMITNRNGEYLFTNLVPGNYQVQFSTTPGGLGFTRQNTPGDNGNNTNSDANSSGNTGTINLSAGESDLTVDAGLYKPTASVGDFVWYDLNNNGVQDAGEPAVPGVIATLYDASNNIIGSAVTNGNGYYLITNVPPGNNYYVIFTNKPAGNFTTQNVGGTAAINNSKANASGQTTTFNVLAGQFVSNIDAGIIMNILVPVRFISFNAQKQNNTTLLGWQVANEQAGQTYTIERSTNGTAFTAIGALAGTRAGSYNFTDVTPVANAKNYYRIRQTDADGRSVTTEIRWVRFDADIKLDIYPNPAANTLSITLGETLLSKSLTIEIVGANGQQVLRRQIDRSSATVQLNIQALAPGAYQLRISSSNAVEAVRSFIKQ